MRKTNLLLFALLLAFAAMAQSVPQGMKYQAAARDLSGNVLAGQQVSLKVSLFSNQNGRRIDHYAEMHEAATTDLGLFSLTIGEGKTKTLLK